MFVEEPGTEVREGGGEEEVKEEERKLGTTWIYIATRGRLKEKISTE